jgi:hypothetical protein
MASSIRDGGTWKQVNGVWIRDASSWKEVQKAWIRDAGSWKEFYSLAPALSRTFEDTRVDAVDGTNSAWTGIAIATAPNANRRIVIAVGASISSATEANAQASAVTINGTISATKRQGADVDTSGSTGSGIALYTATVPTGTTIDVSVDFPASVRRCGIIVWSLIAPAEAPTNSGVGETAGSSSDDLSLTVTNPAGGLGLAAFTDANSTAATLPSTFSGTASPSEVADFLIEGGSNMHGANFAASGTVVCGVNNNLGMVGVWASWAP